MVRFPSKMSKGGRLSTKIRLFSDWMNSHSLVDLQMSGATFMWSNHKDRHSISRLDRFLVLDDWVERYLKVCQFALPKPCSDHCPILLDSKCESLVQDLFDLSCCGKK